MKPWLLLFGAAGLFGGALSQFRPVPESTIIVSGDTNGYLSPCGCTYPMSGGIKRRISAARGTSEFIDNGGLIKGTGRQDRMKAETLIEAMVDADVAAINLTPAEARLGRGPTMALASLAQGRLISTHITDPTLDLPRWKAKGEFLIGAVTNKPESLGQSLGVEAVPLGDAVQALVSEAAATGAKPILLLNGGEDEARELAKAHPALPLIVFSATGEPRAVKTENALLVTPGDRGRFVAKLTWDGKAMNTFQKVDLGPQHADDEGAAAIYNMYLRRLSNAKLIDEIPRVKGDPFAGSAKCGSCHAEPLQSWKNSAHAHALETLDKNGHGQDPDCVTCHTVGIQFDTGFKSRNATPSLSDVGCESCHGAGADHAAAPYLERMGKVEDGTCVSCHDAENSPRFDYKSYWEKIKH